MKKKTFWLDEFKDGKAQGGYYFRAFDLVKFMKLLKLLMTRCMKEEIIE